EKLGERKEKRGGAEREEKEKRVPPKRLDGIGEEAYWSGNRFGGALYVLAKDAIVRISVGGPDNEQIKITKSKALALKALERLPLPSRRHSAPVAAIHNKSKDLTAYSQPHEKVFYFTSSASFARHTECTPCRVGRLIARHVHSRTAHGNNVHRHI